MSLAVVFGLCIVTAVVHRRLLGYFGGGVFGHLVRLPGNLLHEVAHAVAMFATGYSVVGFRVSLFDPAGRGAVHPGPPWIAAARPWLTNLVSPIAPVVAGVAMLVLLHRWGGLPGIPANVSGVVPVLAAVEWGRWQLWVALALAFSVAAELAPSEVDLAAWWRPALVLAVVLGLAGWGVEQVRPGLVLSALWSADAHAKGPAWEAAAAALGGLLVVGPVALVVGRLRG